MEQTIRVRLLLKPKCLVQCLMWSALILNNTLVANPCKYETRNNGSDTSEECFAKEDGKFLIKLCNNQGFCFSDKIEHIKKYKCQVKSPGTSTFCLKLPPIKKGFLPNENFIFNKESMELAVQKEEKKPVVISLTKLNELSSFEDLIRRKGTNKNIYFINMNNQTSHLCGSNSEELRNYYVGNFMNSIPTCKNMK